MSKSTDLTALRAGQQATVQRLSASGAMRRRLQDIGLIEGTRVECVGASPLGDPSAYLIRGAVIALRGSDAAQILVENVSSPLSEHLFPKAGGVFAD